MSKKVKITIDGQGYEVDANQTIFQAAQKLGLIIPHFCYHKKLSIAGNCRLCQVEVEGARAPVISCRESLRDGMVIKINNEETKQIRKDILEFILVNHPLDCPVCDQSGECELQDQYFEHSLQPSKMQDRKINKPKAQKIGPHVHLDDERCVLCTRCIRFCDEIVDDHQLYLQERGGHSQISVFPGKELDNKYSLCTVDICPVGALTSSDFRFKKRVWFLSNTPSVCTGCATGCNIWLDHHDDIAYRMRPRDNDAVNECWACDDGRMTYKMINAKERALFPHKLEQGSYQRINWADALKNAQELIKSVDSSELAGVLSASFSNEENLAFYHFFKEVLGIENIVWAGKSEDKAFADEILRDSDRDPNKRGVQMLADKRISADTQAKVFVVLGNLEDNDLLHLTRQDAKAIWITDTLTPGQTWAEIVLPRSSHAEQDGTFVNRKSILQRFQKAFEPRGESAPAWTVAARLAQSFGKVVVAGSAAQVFEANKTFAAQLSAVDFNRVPAEGMELNT